ncbi:phospholipid carrier-dependent glycosyltransferase [Candidatus Parcubacteria bacterium]|nr:MAG: phospholipid carrier-dependent glycosyltransferase [Candidatus Parcubacteria bacterium]
MNKKFTYIAVALILGVMGALAIGSFWNDAVTTDESPHTVAGYTYLKFKDFRINPEHPPLMKDLAGLPLQFQNLNFPTEHPAWKDNVNDQWWLGPVFLYESGNNPDKIIRSARLSVVIFLFLLGWFVFRFARSTYGTKVALMSLFLFAFSPTFLAHGRYVTTDVGATLGFFIGIFYFLRYLKQRTNRSMVAAGIALGIALLLKFSNFLLVPFIGLLALIASLINWQKPDPQQQMTAFKNSRQIGFALLGIFAIAGILIWIVYAFHVWGYPPERQTADMAHNLSSFGSRFLADTAIKLSEISILRPLAQYLHGLLMVVQRASGGNTTYFLGEVSAAGWTHYFPVVYLIKEQVGLHILTIIAFLTSLGGLWIAWKNLPRRKIGFLWARFKEWLLNYRNFVTLTGLLFIAMYWINSMTSNLNIGVRHVLPTFPFIYMLVSYQIFKWLETTNVKIEPKNPFHIITEFFRSYLATAIKGAFVAFILIWYLLTAVLTYPFYLSYFNELVGGPAKGYLYAVDSNLDWGQDLKRLADFVEKNNIDKIRIDYFGGGSPRYYLGDKFIPWQPSKGEEPGWIAVSATLLMGQTGKTAPGFIRNPQDEYTWLLKHKPVAQIGYSIFVFNIPKEKP